MRASTRTSGRSMSSKSRSSPMSAERRLQRGTQAGQHGGQAHQPEAGVVEPGRRRRRRRPRRSASSRKAPWPLAPVPSSTATPEEPGGQVGQAVAVVGRVEQVGGHRGVDGQAGDVDAERQEGPHQLLGVVGHHADPAGSEPVGQGGQHPSARPPGGPRRGARGRRPGVGRRSAPSAASATRARASRGDRPGSPSHRGARATLPVPARPAPNSATRSRAGLVDVGRDGAHGRLEPALGWSVGAAGRRRPRPVRRRLPPVGRRAEQAVPHGRLEPGPRTLHLEAGEGLRGPPRGASRRGAGRRRRRRAGTSRTSGMTSAFSRTRSAWSARFWRSLGDRASRWA